MTPITELYDQFGVPWIADGHQHCTKGWIQSDCPVCSRGGHHWRLGYNVRSKRYSCWACGRLPLGRTLFLLTGKWGLERQLVAEDWVQEVQKDKGVLVLPDGLGPLQAVHRRYLESRGYDPDAISETWGAKGIGLATRLSWRIWIPLHVKRQVVSWTTRAPTDDTERRYINAGTQEESVSAKTLLYGEDYCAHAVVVHEGPLDVWRTGPGAVATMGLAYSRAQVAKIAKYPVRVICLDAAAEAQKKAERLCRELEVFPGKTYQVVLSSKDAGCATDAEVRKLRSFLR